MHAKASLKKKKKGAQQKVKVTNDFQGFRKFKKLDMVVNDFHSFLMKFKK